MRKLISDFRGRITNLVLSDSDLKIALQSVSWKIELARSLLSKLFSEQEHGLQPPVLIVKLEGISASISSESDFEDFEARWNTKRMRHNHALDHELFPANTSEVSQGSWEEKKTGNATEAAALDCYSSNYIRDHFLVLFDGADTVILDNCFRRLLNRPSARLTELLTDFAHKAEAAEVRLEGGDILVADSLVVLGRKTANDHGTQDEIAFNAKLEAILGLPVFCPGFHLNNYPDLLFHIDLYMTVLGESAGMIDLAIGRIHIWDGGTWIPSTAKEGAKDLQDYLDAIKKMLECRGVFNITEWPLLYEKEQGGVGRLYSYNNCLVDQAVDLVPRLLLPSYNEETDDGLKSKFEVAEDAFEKEFGQKYGINWIPGCFHDDVIAGGSLRCLTQVLRRTTD